MCLTVDDFETIIFATIKGRRNPKKLAGIKKGVETGKGELKLKFEFSKTDFNSDEVYVMIETPTLFEVFYSFSANINLLSIYKIIFALGVPL